MLKGRLYSEVFDEFTSKTTKEEKIGVLRKYDTPNFRNFFRILYDKTIEFDVTIPPYKKAPEPVGLNWMYLEQEISGLYRFLKSSSLSQKKKQELLIVILESLHRDEADILCKLINKNLDINYLNPIIVNEAFGCI